MNGDSPMEHALTETQMKLLDAMVPMIAEEMDRGLNGQPDSEYITRAADEFRRAIARSETTYDEIDEVIQGLKAGRAAFWQRNIRSPEAMFGLCKDKSRKFGRILDDLKEPSNGPAASDDFSGIIKSSGPTDEQRRLLERDGCTIGRLVDAED
jgi:hypothetical protein